MIGWAKKAKRKVERRIGKFSRRLKHAGRRAYVSRLARRYKTEESSERSVLLMSPSKFPGSLGDEAMLIGACEYLQDQGCTVGVLTANDAEIPSYFECFDEVICLEGAYSKGLSSSRRFLDIAQSWDALGVFGADVIDGTYSEERALGMLMRIYEAQCAGMPSQLLGSSVKDRNISPRVKDMAQAIGKDRLTFRDKVSRDRFAEATGLQCDVVADTAFLLRPRSNSSGKSTIEGINNHKRKGHTVWGLNTQWRHFDNHIDRDRYIRNLKNIAKSFDSDFGPSCVVLLPHDKRGGSKSDFQVAQDLRKALKESKISSIIIDESVKSYEIKKICKKIDFVLSMRMHVSIAAMGASCPVASISYQGKFDGLYSHFDIKKSVLNGKNINDQSRVKKFVKREFKSRNKIKSKIEKTKI
jgi:polysaccharide pyruvyl transferase WcaK-like protein